MVIKNIFFFFLFSSFVYTQGQLIFTQAEKVYLKNKKEIKLCFSPKGLPLFGYKNEGNIGILPDIMHLIEKKIPLPFHYEDVKTWEECIGLSKENKVDMVGVIVSHPNKHTHLVPSDKLMSAFIGIATKINEPFFNELNHLEGKKIAFLKAQVTIKHYVMQKFPNIKSVMVESIEEGLTMVTKGQVYGYADDTYSLAYHILNLYSNELKIIERVNKTPISGSIGVQKEDIHLLSIINKAIAEIEEHEVRNIIHDWIRVEVVKGFDYRLFLQILLLFLLVFIVSMFWIKKLLKEVKRRKVLEEKLQDLNNNLENEVSKQLEELYHKNRLLLEKTKLAAMGEMLGSIAHQWRRPLSSLHINIELLETEYDENKINTAFLKLFIEKNSGIIQYMSQTIDDFQNFYKVDKEKISYDVLEKVISVTNLHRDYLDIDNIVLKIEGKSVLTYGYPNEFQQVILNVINNAYDAHKTNKSLNPFIHINIYVKDTNIYIRIIDNAGGINESVLAKIFDHNFSTKGSTRGMGLYISKMIIENNVAGKLSIVNIKNGCAMEIILSLDGERGNDA